MNSSPRLLTRLVLWLHSELQSFLCISWTLKFDMLYSLHYLEVLRGILSLVDECCGPVSSLYPVLLMVAYFQLRNLIKKERKELKLPFPATMSCKLRPWIMLVLHIPLHKGEEAARFAQLWNKIISSFRVEYLINNR